MRRGNVWPFSITLFDHLETVLCTHSYPGAEQDLFKLLKYIEGQEIDYFYASEIMGIEPEVKNWNMKVMELVTELIQTKLTNTILSTEDH